LLCSSLNDTDGLFHAPDRVLYLQIFGNRDCVTEKNVIPIVLKVGFFRGHLLTNSLSGKGKSVVVSALKKIPARRGN
jgi:hypothetical protein